MSRHRGYTGFNIQGEETGSHLAIVQSNPAVLTQI